MTERLEFLTVLPNAVRSLILVHLVHESLIAGLRDDLLADGALDLLLARILAGRSLIGAFHRLIVGVCLVGVDGLKGTAIFAVVVTHTCDRTLAVCFVAKILAVFLVEALEHADFDGITVEIVVPVVAVPDLTDVVGKIVVDDSLAAKHMVGRRKFDFDLDLLLRRGDAKPFVCGNGVGEGLEAFLRADRLGRGKFVSVSLVDDRVAVCILNDLAVLIKLVERGDLHRDSSAAADLALARKNALCLFAGPGRQRPACGVVTDSLGEGVRPLFAARAFDDLNTAIFADGLTFCSDEADGDAEVVAERSAFVNGLAGDVTALGAVDLRHGIFRAGCRDFLLNEGLLVVDDVVDDLGVAAFLVDLKICTVVINGIAVLVQDGIFVRIKLQGVLFDLDEVVVALVLAIELGDRDGIELSAIGKRDDKGLTIFAEHDACDTVAAAGNLTDIRDRAIGIGDLKLAVLVDLRTLDLLAGFPDNLAENIGRVVRVGNNELAICVDRKRLDALRLRSAAGECECNADHAADNKKDHQKFNSQLSDSLNHCLFSLHYCFCFK